MRLPKKTLDAEHVTGAQIAVLNEGKLVWSAAFGLRRKNPDLPMDAETTTWAASITKSVFSTYVMRWWNAASSISTSRSRAS